MKMKDKLYDMNDNALQNAHHHTLKNREEIERSQTCYCICCENSFPPSKIESYTDGGATAICPYCDCDAVIGDACGIKLTDDLLKKLNEKYF